MDLLFQYYDLILAVIVAVCALGYGIYKFVSTPSEKQKEQIRTVLLQLVVQAEKSFGSKTGKIKLRNNGFDLKFIPNTLQLSKNI